MSTTNTKCFETKEILSNIESTLHDYTGDNFILFISDMSGRHEVNLYTLDNDIILKFHYYPCDLAELSWWDRLLDIKRDVTFSVLRDKAPYLFLNLGCMNDGENFETFKRIHARVTTLYDQQAKREVVEKTIRNSESVQTMVNLLKGLKNHE